MSLRDGRLRLPASARLTGRRLQEVGEREVTFCLPLSHWLLGPSGRLHPGALIFLGDSALTGAVLTGLASGILFATAELSMTFLGAMPSAGGELTARAELLHLEERHALAVADVRGPGGERLAFGTARTFLRPPIDVSSFPALPPPTPEPEQEGADPWQRAATGSFDPVAARDSHGRAVLEQTLSGDRLRPPVDRLFGVQLTGVGEGDVAFQMLASPWLGNELGMVSGGSIGLLALSATSAAGQTVARPGSPYRALDLKLNFLEPVPTDGEPIVARGRAVHEGKLLVAQTEVRHGGELVAVATGSTVLGA